MQRNLRTCSVGGWGGVVASTTGYSTAVTVQVQRAVTSLLIELGSPSCVCMGRSYCCCYCWWRWWGHVPRFALQKFTVSVQILAELSAASTC